MRRFVLSMYSVDAANSSLSRPFCIYFQMNSYRANDVTSTDQLLSRALLLPKKLAQALLSIRDRQ